VTTRRRPGLAPHELRADADAPLGTAQLGIVDYREAWDLQRRLVDLRRTGEVGDLLLLLEHPAVYTMGKRTDRAHLLFDDTERARRGIDLVEVDRGGDITYHGPGQLVGYPILRLASIRGVVDYVRTVEEVLIRALARFGVVGQRSEGYTGVWVDDEKIAAIGVRVASGAITSHGFALNVAPPMDHFSGIVPCGITDRGVTSLAAQGVNATVTDVAVAVTEAVGEVFVATLEAVPAETILTRMELTP
jgi:lipoyl(octanoyl) transferase